MDSTVVGTITFTRFGTSNLQANKEYYVKVGKHPGGWKCQPLKESCPKSFLTEEVESRSVPTWEPTKRGVSGGGAPPVAENCVVTWNSSLTAVTLTH